MNFPLPSSDPFGTDLKIDDSGDIVTDISGSIYTIGNADNVAQAIRTNITTIPNTYLWGNTVGTDLSKYVDEPISGKTNKLIQTVVLNKVQGDSRITKVDNIDINTDVKDTLIVTINAEVSLHGAVQILSVIGGV